MPCAQRTQALAHCIDGDADAIVISGYPHASEQQARQASTATYGGEVLCDLQPFRASSVCNSAFASVTGEATRVWIVNDLNCDTFDIKNWPLAAEHLMMEII